MLRNPVRLVVWMAACAALVAGCSERSSPETRANRAQRLISDEAHQGKEHFFFLPPMVPAPSPGGVFDATLAPRVQICELASAGCVEPPLAVFTTTTGPGSETVRLVREDEHYAVNWHTDTSALDENKTYRISVFAEATELGFADVDVASGGKDLMNVDTGEFIALKDGRTLPIKFRVEQGACISSVTTDPTCDGMDDDCDGKVDEDYVGAITACGVGACEAVGETTCVLGQVVDQCTPAEPALQDATCDGIDDDCDGEVDEDYVGVATACGIGACAVTGTISCVSGQLQDDCTPGEPAPSDATCDGVDDDCDGEVDEDYAGVATGCGVGACEAVGETTCMLGQVVDQCTPAEPALQDATCDGIDDDCDGEVDEDYVGVATACGIGACAATGTTVCLLGQVQDTCLAGTPATTDATCDGADDDCDGETDEDYLPLATTCAAGPCGGEGMTSCVLGQVHDDCAAPETCCGDGLRQDGEACDGDDLAGQLCEHLGFAGGTLACAPDCTLETSGCTNAQPICGNGVAECERCASAVVQASGTEHIHGRAIAIDEIGNRYAAGSFCGTATFGSQSFTSPNSGGMLECDAFVTKLDASGNFLWTTVGGGTGQDAARDLVRDAEGNIYIAGLFSDSATFGSTVLTSNGGSDWFVAKLDASGNYLWAKAWGKSSTDGAAGVALDGNGNLIVVGVMALSPSYYDTVMGLSGADGHGNGDVVVAKLDADGNVVWARSAGASSWDSAVDVAVDSSDNIHVTGTVTAGTATFGSLQVNVASGSEAYVAELDASGNFVWVSTAAGGSSAAGTALAVDSAGNTYVAGSMRGPLTAGTLTVPMEGSSWDYFVAKLDPLGGFVWATSSVGKDAQEAQSLALDDQGNVFIGGTFYTYAAFGDIALGGPNANHGYVAKLSSIDGRFLAATAALGFDVNTYGITVDEWQSVHATGGFMRTVDFGGTSLTAESSFDAFFWRYTEVNKERCDGADLDGQTCRSAGSAGGSLACNAACELETSSCYRCGDGIKNGQEDCDDADFGELTCGSFGFHAGELTCDSRCVVDTLACVGTCGDGTINGLEECDGFNLGGLTCLSEGYAAGQLDCTTDCNLDASGCSTTASPYWVAQAGGTAHDQGRAIAVDAAGNSYVAGSFCATASIGGDSFSSPNGGGAMECDAFVTKLDASGNFLWATPGGGAGGDIAEDLVRDAAGNIYIAGWIGDDATFGSTALATKGSADWLVAKLDGNGSVLWAKSWGTRSTDQAMAIALDTSGNLVVAGLMSLSALYDETAMGLAGTDGYGRGDIVVAKLDTDGHVLWARAAGSAGWDSVGDVAVSPANEILVTGSVASGTSTFGSHQVTTSATEAYVAQLDTSGGFTWVATAQGGWTAAGNDIVADASGNSYVVGSMHGALTADGLTVPMEGASWDYFVAKLDSAGSFVWATSSVGTAAEQALAITLDHAGDIVISGEYYASSTFGTTTLSGGWGYYGYLAWLDPGTGAFTWAKNIPGQARACGLVANGADLLAAGYFRDTVSFDGTPLTSRGQYDAFVWSVAGP